MQKAIDYIPKTTDEWMELKIKKKTGEGGNCSMTDFNILEAMNEDIGVWHHEKLINGISMKENPLLCKQQFAYIPDNPDLYEYLTGIQYLNFIADVFEVPVTDREQRIEKYADAFEITESLGDLISSYSHGMKQKLAIISALVHKPKLLILDEPFVGLDPKAAVVLKTIMRELCENGGAIFFSTHVLDVAEKLCNKVAIIKDGVLLKEGKMEKIVKQGESLESIFMEVASIDKAD